MSISESPPTTEPAAEQSALPDVVAALAASPRFADDGVVFAARSSGLYRSDDGGKSWRSLYGSLELDEPLATTAVAVSPTWASDRTVFAGANGGVLRSLDGGETWQITLLPEPAPLVVAIALSPGFERDGVVFAATMEDGVFRSADRGGSWTAWNFGLLDLGALCLAVAPNYAADETLFVGTESGLFRSTNGGLAWREVAFPSEYAPVLCFALASNASGGSLFAGTEEHGLWRSDDGGRSWAAVGEDVLGGPINGIVAGPDPSTTDLLVLLSDGLMVSRDGAASWQEWQAGLRFEGGAASIVAPLGLGADAPLLVGTVDNGVVRV